MSIPNFEGNEEKYVMDAVKQGWVSTGGAYVEMLEKKIAKYTDMPSCVACQSGTSGLHMTLLESGVKPDDMVIAPALTFIAAVNPIKYVNAYPVFMDCDDSLCIDPVKLKDFCENECIFINGELKHAKSGKRISAIIVVHVFGNLADMEAIMEISKKYNLTVIEDATEALGTICDYGKYKGKMAGTIGDFGVYSFNGNKIITTGGGGAVVSKDETKLKHLKYMSTQCKDDEHFYIHNEIGFNYRMTNVQAAIGVAQLEELEEFIERKNKNYDIYVELLKETDNGYMLPFRDGVRANKWFYSFVVNKDLSDKNIREYILKFQDEGVQTRPIWGLINQQKPYMKDVSYKIERALFYKERVINLPCSTNLNKEQIKRVCEVLYKMNER